MNLFLGQMLAILTSVCWAQNSLIYSYVGKRTGSATVTHIRLWIALPLILIAHVLFTGSISIPGLTWNAFAILTASGFIGFFIADLFIFRAFIDLGPRMTMVIMLSSPIISALLSRIFLGQKLTMMQTIGIAVIILGVSAVIIAEHRGQKGAHPRLKTGIALAFAGAITQAAGMVLAKGGLDMAIHPVTANGLRIIGGLAGLVLFALIRGKFIEDFRKMGEGKNLMLLAFAALVGPVLGVVLSLFAMNLAPVGVVTVLMQMTPIILLPVDHFLFKQPVPRAAVFASFVAVGGTALLFI